MALSQSQGSKNFGPGRIILLFDQHFSEYCPAVVIRQASKDVFLVLAAVSQERKSGKLG